VTLAAQAVATSALDDLAVLRRSSSDWGWLEVRQPRATAAFSRRDTRRPGYRQASEVADRHGFEPVVRPAGGQLAAYHEGALALSVVGRHPAPADGVGGRFTTFSRTLVDGLRRLGVDARLGPVPGEYCPGTHSVNAGGRTKLAGTAQRMTPGSFFLGAVVVVSEPEPIRSLLTEAYPLLGHPLDPATVGCVADQVAGVTTGDVREVLLDSLRRVLPLAPTPCTADDEACRLALTGCWSP
jgi:octanoyl-[GcvH]:protein N-octanoyltransferase